MIRHVEENECEKIEKWLEQNDYSIMECLGAIILRMKGYNIQNWDREIVIGEDTYNVEMRKIQK